MVKYSLIMEYLKKGNNYSQIATLCGCSKTTVWEVLKRIDYPICCLQIPLVNCNFVSRLNDERYILRRRFSYEERRCLF